MRKLILILTILLASDCKASMFGEETIVLAKMLANQIIELERLADSVGLAQENRDMLAYVNEGIERTTKQIEAIDSIIGRAQGLDPNSLKNLSELTNLLNETKALQQDTSELLQLKVEMTDQAIAQGAVQAETSYLMGQEMIGLGASYAEESKSASPGRATQITAAAQSSQMMSSGVMLQNMAQQTQLIAMNLELQKSLVERDLRAQNVQREFFRESLNPRNQTTRRARR